MKILLLITVSFFSSLASATSWNINSVLSGSDGGFGFSSLHNASGANVMSGAKFEDITGATGTYDDVSGATNFVFSLSNNTSFNLVGNLLFDNAGWLANNSALAYTGLTLPSTGTASNGSFGFKLGDVCCSGAHDPNSFQTSTGNLKYLTLWGADGFNANSGTYSNSTVGMDFRLELAPSAVPLPAAVWLFSSALLGLVGVRRKKS